MFILTKFEDLVQISPHEFYEKSRDCIEDKINEKYSNKVVQRVGLCICMWDLIKASDGLIGFGTGTVNVNVEFRMVVFRPFKGEIVSGKVKQSVPDGIHVSTDFFDDIFVPKTMLFEGCRLDEAEKVWVWNTGEAEYWFDNGTLVNVRVEIERWEDPASTGSSSAGAVELEKRKSRPAPYMIEASMAEEGLGGMDWCLRSRYLDHQEVRRVYDAAQGFVSTSTAKKLAPEEHPVRQAAATKFEEAARSKIRSHLRQTCKQCRPHPL